MKRNLILVIALALTFGITSTLFANVYATGVSVDATVIAAGTTSNSVEISFLLNENADSGVDVKIYNSGATLVRTITLATAVKGDHAVIWDGKDDSAVMLPDGDYTFSVTAKDDGYTEWTKISDPLKTVMYSPKGVVINRNPESPYFGTVYISNGYAGTSSNTGAFYNGDGIFVFSAAQDSLDFSTGGVDWTNSSESPGKTSIGLDDRVYVTDYGRDELWSFDAKIDAASSALIIDTDNKETGDYVSGNWVTGSGADRAIYTANMHYGAYRGIVKYNLGTNDILPTDDTGVEIIARPNGSYYQGDVEVDAAGNIYFTQYRAAADQAYPLLKYPPYTGTQLTLADTLWTVPKSVFNAKGLALDEASNRVVWASEYDGNLVIHNATTGAIMDTLVTGQSRNKDVAFDAAGNMYTIDNGTEYWNIWASPDGANEYTTPGLATISIETAAPGDISLGFTFEDDSDVANWGVNDGASGYTTVAWDATAGVAGSGALVFGDAGYGFYIDRPITATPGADWTLTVDVKSAGWDVAGTYDITLSVTGLGDSVGVSVNSLTDFTTVTLSGKAINGAGYIKIKGANVGGANNVWIDNLKLEEIPPPPADVLLDLAFEDDTDVANWGVNDGASGYTTVAWDATAGVAGSGALVFGDAGYGFYIDRPITATPGQIWSLSADVKSAGWDVPGTYDISLSVTGLGDSVGVSINSLTDFTTLTLSGLALNGAGFIKIKGGNTAGANNVWIDNLKLVEEQDLDPDVDPPEVVDVLVVNDTSVVLVFSEAIETGSATTVTNYSFDNGLGNPITAIAGVDTVTLALPSALVLDSLYTLTITGVTDMVGNAIVNGVVDIVYSYDYPQDLFFSEYIEGGSSNKALEIYNPTDAIIDLSGYLMKGTSNDAVAWEYDYVFPDSASTIDPFSVYVIADGSADSVLKAVADWIQPYPSPTSYNGDDARGIFRIVGKDTILIDVFGYTVVTKYDNFDVAGVPEAALDHTIVRKASVTTGNTDWALSAGTNSEDSEWVVFPKDAFQWLGAHPHPDLFGPELAGIVAVSETQLQLRFNEPVDSASAVILANYVIDGGIGSPTGVTGIRDNMFLLDVPTIQMNVPYTLTVNGVSDLLGIVGNPDATVLFDLDDPGWLPIDKEFSDFGSDVGNWGHPTYSGSTYGIADSSTFKVTDALALADSTSAEMALYDDNSRDGGWFVRLWNINRVDRLAADSEWFFYLRGGNAEMQIRLVVRDDDGYETSAWHEVTMAEDDWQVISLDLANDEVFGWINGNGMINATGGSVAIDGIQIRSPEDISTNLYFDLMTERPNIDPVAVTLEVDMSVQALYGNFVIGTDNVDVAGSFNDWGGSAIVLEDADSDSIYSTILTNVYPGETLEYKFRMNSNWDTSEFPGGGANRVYVVPDTASVVYAWYNDESTYVGVDGSNLPMVFALHNNYPNPFNPITNIKYDVPENTHVVLAVYNTLGQHVIDLVNEDQEPGYYNMQWNGLTKFGTPVSSGLYIYRITTPEFTQSEKMIFLK